MRALPWPLVLALLWAAPLQAQQAELPPLTQEAEPELDAPPLEPPADASVAADAAAVAKDAYLGGAGVVGPLALVSALSYAAPFLGGIAGGWASQQTHPNLGGQWLRGILASLTVTAVAYLVALVGEVPLIVAASALGGILGAGLFIAGYWQGTNMVLAGGSVEAAMGSLVLGMAGMLLGMGVAYGLASLVYWIPLVAAGWLAVKAGDVVWESLWTDRGIERSHERSGPLGARLPGEAPLNVVLAGGLMAAAKTGRAVRHDWIASFPVVGPWIAWRLSSDDEATRMEQARRLAGYADGADVRGLNTGVGAARAAFLSIGMLVLPAFAATLTLAAASVAMVGMALAFPVITPTVFLAIAGVAGLGAVLAGGLSAVSFISLYAAAGLRYLEPWILASYGLFSARAMTTEG